MQVLTRRAPAPSGQHGWQAVRIKVDGSSNLKRTWLALYYGLKAGLRVFKSTKWPRQTKSSFEPLTPVLLEDDRFARYEPELLDALNNDDILNIALTGG